jgi:hypothetical protein
MPPKKRVRKPRARKPKVGITPRTGDQSLLQHGADGTEVVSPAVKPPALKPLASKTAANSAITQPRPAERCFPEDSASDDKELKPAGKVYRWYSIHGARGNIWVRAASPADALGTYRVSRFYHNGDDRPVHRGRTIAELPPGAAGLERKGKTLVQEVIGQQPKKK